MACVLSLDFGTGGLRAGVFDAGDGRTLSAAATAYPTRTLPPDRAEQDPADWWRAALSAVPRALAEAGSPRIGAVCLAAFSSTVIAADRDGRALAPAILWMDARAATEAERTATVDHPLIALCGGQAAAEWLVPKAMWMKRADPALWARAAVVAEALDLLNHRLTGEWTGSAMTATCKWTYDPRARRFDPGLFAALGIPDLIERLPGRIVPVGGEVGRMTAAAAAELGVAGRPLVVQGGIDGHMGAFGAGTVDAGDMLFIGGSSNVILLNARDDGRPVTGVWGPYPDALVPGLRLVEGGQVSAGSVLSWFAERILGLDAAGHAALAAEAAERAAAAAPLALDYFMGNRTPYRDARLRGALVGLTLADDRASLYRALVTAVALGSANILRDLERQGLDIGRVVLAGGILRNPAWLAATIAAIGRPVQVSAEENLTLRGCAAVAAAGLGLWPSPAAAARALAAPAAERAPDAADRQALAGLLDRYRAATGALRPIMHDLPREAAGR